MTDNQKEAGKVIPKRAFLSRTRWTLAGLMVGLLSGAWLGGGTDRYGQSEGVFSGLRGAYGTIVRGWQYSVATFRDCTSNDHSSAHNLGLVRQIQNRIWQDKELAAEAIVVELDEGGKVVLTGQVPDMGDKEKAVALARDTRGVESVIDQLAVATESRTIEAGSSEAVPTGVASGARVVR